jgi:hypothetical protein
VILLWGESEDERACVWRWMVRCVLRLECKRDLCEIWRLSGASHEAGHRDPIAMSYECFVFRRYKHALQASQSFS